MYFHCPPRDRWAALLHDELPADEQADLDAHLEGCPACQRILEDCAAHRDVWAGARKLREQSPHDFALRTVMERLKTDPDAEPAVE
ncbi:MAG TPA: zf-HC2 domain-containing protein, partial [Gemmataceae bacterium]|nr:zf-HC2 domain-containing protein [Gemmataceae bacterium]